MYEEQMIDWLNNHPGLLAINRFKLVLSVGYDVRGFWDHTALFLNPPKPHNQQLIGCHLLRTRNMHRSLLVVPCTMWEADPLLKGRLLG